MGKYHYINRKESKRQHPSALVSTEGCCILIFS